MIDTHTHLYDSAFDEDFDEVVSRALTAGVSNFIFPGIDSTYHAKMMECTGRLPGKAYPAIGLHPTSVGDDWRTQLDFVTTHLDDYPFVAIGEIGLDGHWSKEFMVQQKEVFLRQLIIAGERNLPVIIHVRDAMDDVFAIFDSLKPRKLPLRGTFHAFSGSYETYQRIKTYGDFKIGIGGVITYRNAGIADVLRKIPISDIVIETDSPWLTPSPFRGKRNESSYICIVAEKIAEIKGISLKEVDEITTSNAQTLFNLR